MTKTAMTNKWISVCEIIFLIFPLLFNLLILASYPLFFSDLSTLNTKILINAIGIIIKIEPAIF